MSKLLNRLFPLSISSYATGLVAVGLAVFVGLSLLMMHRINLVRAEVAQSNQEAATHELRQALQKLLDTADLMVRELERWDEVKQQLADPTYYIYWRENRLKSSGLFPESLEIAELYNAQGKVLAPPKFPEMPARIQAGETGGRIIKLGQSIHLYYFAPIFAPRYEREGRTVLGYVGLKIDFLGALQSMQSFRYANVMSIEVQAESGVHIPQDEVLPLLKFEAIPNPETKALQQVMVNTLYQFAALFTTVALLAYLFLIYGLGLPLRRLCRHIDTLRKGHVAQLAQSFQGLLPLSELETVRVSLNDYQTQLDEAKTSIQQRDKKLRVLTRRDPLTGVLNRHGFAKELERIKDLGVARKTDVVLMLFDCDHFKSINDSYGHDVGDRVIQAVAELLQTVLGEESRFYRTGGDEFAGILLDTSVARAEAIAKQCLEAVADYPFSELGVREPIRISVGIAFAQAVEPDQLADLQWQADMAMYHAKQPGQGKIVVYAAEMEGQSHALMSNWVTTAIFDAMASGETFEMHYQPVVNLASRTTEYYEALIRIRVDDELILPSSIFPVVEARRLEVDFDYASFDQVLRDVASGGIPSGTGVSINISGPSLVAPGTVERLRAFEPYMKDYRIVLEITETTLITQLQRASDNLNKLRRAGFAIALDDFGNGYSSFRYLANMPVDIVKFDRTMVDSLGGQDKQGLIAERVAALMLEAGYKIVAEGIETEKALDKVVSLGFSSAQGDLLGRPEKIVP